MLSRSLIFIQNCNAAGRKVQVSSGPAECKTNRNWQRNVTKPIIHDLY